VPERKPQAAAAPGLPAPRRKPGRDPAPTRERLLDAAEKLFAERGIDNVTMIDVTQAARQRNRAALQYHFGDKQRLLLAVLERHSDAIAQHRARLIDELEQRPGYTLRDVVEVLVVPIVERFGAGGSSYVQIHSQLMASQHWAEVRLQLGSDNAQAARMMRMQMASMPKLAKSELEARLILIDVMLFHGLASYASRARKPNFRHFTRSMIDAITGVLGKPAGA
jgi:AcrR family transcriptional regulator